MGNLTSRTDVHQGVLEAFTYDALNRLTSNTVNATLLGPAQSTHYAYDDLGNLTCKSDLGTCSSASPNMTYGATVTAGGTTRSLPHALARVTGTVRGAANPSYSYDANGNMVSGGGLTYLYTSFNMPQAIAAATYSAGFQYGPEHQRVMQVTTTSTVVYLHPDQSNGLHYEKELRGSTVTHKHYIAGVAVVTLTGSNWATQYLHRDHLGSVTAITNQAGAVIERLAYDPWGKRRFPNGAADPGGTLRGNPAIASVTDRGFTNHEHLDGLGLVHMNGRIFDPVLARFTDLPPLAVPVITDKARG
nr:hypothetical protein [Thauera linaloolentis]